MKDTADTPEEPPKEPPIILISVAKKSYTVYKGDEYLNQMMLVDGDFPKPILCVHFETIFDAKRVLGASFSPQTLWSVHPEIVARLRDTKVLVETNA